jgi:hypothetical protein
MRRVPGVFRYRAILVSSLRGYVRGLSVHALFVALQLIVVGEALLFARLLLEIAHVGVIDALVEGHCRIEQGESDFPAGCFAGVAKRIGYLS